jgi:integrase
MLLLPQDRKGWLFRTAKGWKGTKLADQPMDQSDAWRMIRRRAAAAGIHAPIGNHTFRATGITAYLECGGTLEHAQEMAAHESPRTTKLYDRTKERLTLDEIERIRLSRKFSSSSALKSIRNCDASTYRFGRRICCAICLCTSGDRVCVSKT